MYMIEFNIPVVSCFRFVFLTMLISDTVRFVSVVVGFEFPSCRACQFVLLHIPIFPWEFSPAHIGVNARQ